MIKEEQQKRNKKYVLGGDRKKEGMTVKLSEKEWEREDWEKVGGSRKVKKCDRGKIRNKKKWRRTSLNSDGNKTG